MDKMQDVIELLTEYNQLHIVNWLNKLDENKKRELIEQINHIDLHQIAELYYNAKKRNKIQRK